MDGFLSDDFGHNLRKCLIDYGIGKCDIILYIMSCVDVHQTKPQQYVDFWGYINRYMDEIVTCDDCTIPFIEVYVFYRLRLESYSVDA